MHRIGVRVLVALDLEGTTNSRSPEGQRTGNDFHNTKIDPMASFRDLDMRISFRVRGVGS